MERGLFLLITSLFTSMLYAQPYTQPVMPTQKWEVNNPVFDANDIDSLKTLISNADEASIRIRACQILFIALNKSEKIRINDINDLLANYEKEKDENIKSEIINCLWIISEKEKDERILNLAIDIVRSPNRDLYKALIIINNFGGDKRVEDNLIEFIEKGPDENYLYQEAAMQCLGAMKSDKAVPSLYRKMIALLKDKENNNFSIPTSYPTALTPSPSLGKLYIYFYAACLSKIGGEKVTILVAPTLDDKDIDMKQRGAMILGYLGDVRSVPVLCDIILKSKDPGMRTCAIYYLSNIGDKRAIPALIKAFLKDDYKDFETDRYPLRYDAYKALLKLGVKVERDGRDNYKVIE